MADSFRRNSLKKFGKEKSCPRGNRFSLLTIFSTNRQSPTKEDSSKRFSPRKVPFDFYPRVFHKVESTVYYLDSTGGLASLEFGPDGRFGRKIQPVLLGNFRSFDADKYHVVGTHLKAGKVSIKQLTGELTEKESETLVKDDFKLNHVLLARGVVVAIGYSASSTMIQILDKKSLKIISDFEDKGTTG
jgi:hypothetical protein